MRTIIHSVLAGLVRGLGPMLVTVAIAVVVLGAIYSVAVMTMIPAFAIIVILLALLFAIAVPG